MNILKEVGQKKGLSERRYGFLNFSPKINPFLVFSQTDGLGLGEGGVLEALMFDFAQLHIKSTNVQSSTEAPLLPNRC